MRGRILYIQRTTMIAHPLHLGINSELEFRNVSLLGRVCVECAGGGSKMNAGTPSPSSLRRAMFNWLDRVCVCVCLCQPTPLTS